MSPPRSLSVTGANVSHCWLALSLPLMTLIGMLSRGLCSQPEQRLGIRVIRRPQGIHRSRGLSVCNSPERQLESSVCLQGDDLIEYQDINKASLKSELMDPGSMSGWKYGGSEPESAQQRREGLPALEWGPAESSWLAGL